MPPLALHLRIAQDAAAAVGLPLLSRHLGAYLLGSTTPDARGLLGWPRERTHFSLLSEAGDGLGLERMFVAQPHLAEARSLDPATAAFVAGYRTHLVTDDLWIREVYRPYFGEHSPMGGSAIANVIDRALQFELDNAERLDRARVAGWQALLDEADSRVDVGFLDGAILARWRTAVVASTHREPTWERFRSLAEGVLLPAGKIEEAALIRFLSDLPHSLDDVHSRVSPEAIAAFRHDSLAASVTATAAYLT